MYSLVLQTARLLISFLQTLMLVTALLSWIPQMRYNRVYQTLSMLIEPIVTPFRKLISMLPFLDEFPLDFSFLAAYLTLSILGSMIR